MGFGFHPLPSGSLKVWAVEKKESQRRKGSQRMRCLDDITSLMDMSFSKLQELISGREVWHIAILWVAKSQTQLSD